TALILLSYEHAQMQEQHRRESLLEDFQDAVSAQGHKIDSELGRCESLIEGLAGRASEILSRATPGEEPFYLNEDFNNPAHQPPALTPSPYYGKPVSVEFPVYKLAPGVTTDSVSDRIQHLAMLRPVFKDVLLESFQENPETIPADEARKLILDG